jgi:hypothetical protein
MAKQAGLADGGRTGSAALVALLCGGLLWGVGSPESVGGDAALDPLAQSIVDSLGYPPPSTPRKLLDAVIAAADVEAFGTSLDYLKQLVQQIEQAGEGRLDLLADLGDGVDPGALRRLERTLGAWEPSVLPVLQAMREASSLRLRDPRQLARAIADLRDGSHATRTAATDRLGRAGIDALPALVELLQTTDAEGGRARTIARGLVRELGSDGREALLAWLASGDLPHWPGVIAALDGGFGSEGTQDGAEFFLAPALVPDTPQPIRDRAITALRRHAARCAPDEDPALWQPPTRGEAVAVLSQRLDRVLSPAGLPPTDCLLPVGDFHEAAVERFLWDQATGMPQRLDLSPRASRALDAQHLARDLVALAATEPDAVRLVMLARLEATLAQASLRGDGADGGSPIDRIPQELLMATLTGPDGLDVEAVADVLDLAVVRGMFEAAAAAARALEYAALPALAKADTGSAPLPRPARKALVRALAVPDATLQFNAARTLALAGGARPYPGSSRVVEVLLHAATATGTDRVVVAHPDIAIAHELATNFSRFGYEPVRVSTGRAAIVAAREHRDTVLVVLSARLIEPSAYETTQFIQQQDLGDIPPVLVVVDPLDDEARGRFLTKLIMKFTGVECVAIVDRLDSFFEPVTDAATGEVTMPARFPQTLAQLAGPRAADPASRTSLAAIRREESRQAEVLLEILARRCQAVREPVAAAIGPHAAGPGRSQYNQVPDVPPSRSPDDAALLQPTR